MCRPCIVYTEVGRGPNDTDPLNTGKEPKLYILETLIYKKGT
jgi:hypothetical protein